MEIRTRHAIFALMLVGLSFSILSHGCSLEEPENRKIRAHTMNYDGVAHGARAEEGARYCHSCHGEDLGGGSNSEPSCYQCHGQNWLKIDPTETRSPDDHTKMAGGFRHHPDLETPASVCTNCHGSQLQGDDDQNTASCYLCHEQVWE